MKKLFLIFLTTALLMCAVSARQDPSVILTDLGYSFSENFTKSSFTIPKNFDMVYNNYNELQKEAGYDLSLYQGKECVIYTYEVFDHPFGKAQAHIITYKGEIIGGDIASVSLSGFMTPLM